MTMNSNGKVNVWTAGENGFCKETGRYHSLFYVALEKKEFYADVSCRNFDVATETAEDMAIQFLDYDKMSIIDKAYDNKLFSQIEAQAKIQFLEMKDEEKVSGAV